MKPFLLLCAWLLGVLTVRISLLIGEYLRSRFKSTPLHVDRWEVEEIPVVRKGDLIVQAENGTYRKLQPSDVQADMVIVGIAEEDVTRTEFRQVKIPKDV